MYPNNCIKILFSTIRPFSQYIIHRVLAEKVELLQRKDSVCYPTIFSASLPIFSASLPLQNSRKFFLQFYDFFLQFYGLQNCRKFFFYTSVEKCMEKMGVSCKKIMSLLKLETVLATVTFCLSFQGTIQCCLGYLLVFFLLLMVPFVGVGRANPKTRSLRSLVWV